MTDFIEMNGNFYIGQYLHTNNHRILVKFMIRMKRKFNMNNYLLVILMGFSLSSKAFSQSEEQGREIFSQFTAHLFNVIADRTAEFNRVTRDEVLFHHLYNTAPSPEIKFNIDFNDSLMALNPIASVYYSNNLQDIWNSQTCSQLGSTGYENTWQCDVTNFSGAYLNWYFQTSYDFDGERAVITQSPANPTNSFPPSDGLFASIAIEEEGDQQNGEGYLDITDLQVTYSEDRVFIQLLSFEGGFPVGEFFGPWFLYGAGFLNPEQDLNSNELIIYAIGYANGAFGNLYPGVMKIIGTPDGEIISADYISDDIEYHLNGNSLYLSTAIATIVEDPDFGNWPNEFNGFTVMGLTASADIDQNMLFHDATEAGIFLMDSQYQAGNNQMDISEVNFDDINQVLSVNYSDPEANLPFNHYISHQDEIWEMIPSSHDYESVVEFSYPLINPEDGAYNVVFHFSDGNSDDEINLSFVIGDPSECLPAGDLDESGDVDVLDVVLLVSLILCDECTLDEPCLDVNLDDSVDVLDVVLLVNIILTD